MYCEANRNDTVQVRQDTLKASWKTCIIVNDRSPEVSIHLQSRLSIKVRGAAQKSCHRDKVSRRPIARRAYRRLLRCQQYRFLIATFCSTHAMNQFL